MKWKTEQKQKGLPTFCRQTFNFSKQKLAGKLQSFMYQTCILSSRHNLSIKTDLIGVWKYIYHCVPRKGGGSVIHFLIYKNDTE